MDQQKTLDKKAEGECPEQFDMSDPPPDVDQKEDCCTTKDQRSESDGRYVHGQWWTREAINENFRKNLIPDQVHAWFLSDEKMCVNVIDGRVDLTSMTIEPVASSSRLSFDVTGSPILAGMPPPRPVSRSVIRPTQLDNPARSKRSQFMQRTYTEYTVESTGEYTNSDILNASTPAQPAAQVPHPMPHSTYEESIEDAVAPQSSSSRNIQTSPQRSITDFLEKLKQLKEKRQKDKQELFRKFGLVEQLSSVQFPSESVSNTQKHLLDATVPPTSHSPLQEINLIDFSQNHGTPFISSPYIDLSDNEPCGPTGGSNLMIAMAGTSQTNETEGHRLNQWTGVAMDQPEVCRSGRWNDGGNDKLVKTLQEQYKLLKEELREKREQLRSMDEALKKSQELAERVVPVDPSLEDTVLVSPNEASEAELLGQSQPFTVLANVDASVGTRSEPDIATGSELAVHTLEENLENATTSYENSDAILGQVAQFLEMEFGEEVTKDQVLEKVRVLTLKLRGKEVTLRTIKMALELESSFNEFF